MIKPVRLSAVSALLWVAIEPTQSIARDLTGSAIVVDGDTIRIESTSIRLWGIDAPERKQMCGANPCGKIATNALKSLIEAHHFVSCTEKNRDKYGRTVAVCRAGAKDLSAEMVKAGHALAFRRYSLDYVAQEERARSANLGAWAYGLTDPSLFRKAQHQRQTGLANRPNAPSQPRQSEPCMVKGNINLKGERIYHDVASRSYNSVVPERCFDTVATALAAGFRAPKK
jgi:endonuclease YncB( thermonuclease family)